MNRDGDRSIFTDPAIAGLIKQLGIEVISDLLTYRRCIYEH